MNDADQRKIFWLLKRYSSLAYWNYVAAFQREFLHVIEQVVQNHPDNDPTPGQIDIYKRSLDDVCNLDEGLRRLASGDRSVFHRHTEGYLVWNGDGYGLLMDLIRQNCSDYYGPDEYYPRGGELMRLALQANSARTSGLGVFEPEVGAAAWWYATWILLPENLPEYAFPNPLPLVPAPPEPTITVKTGKEVPVDGIYEPEGDGTCMNYLLGGTTAPLVMREYGEIHESIFHKGRFIRSVENIPTSWHLIWEDHCYEDGTVPEEEKEYFLPLPEEASPLASEPIAKDRALPGESCTHPGYWWTPAKERSRRRFERGDIFPDFPGSQYGATIWSFDRNQEE